MQKSPNVVKFELLQFMTLQEVFKLSMVSKDIYRMINHNTSNPEGKYDYEKFLEKMVEAQFDLSNVEHVFGPENPSNLKKVFFFVKKSFNLSFRRKINQMSKMISGDSS